MSNYQLTGMRRRAAKKENEFQSLVWLLDVYNASKKMSDLLNFFSGLFVILLSMAIAYLTKVEGVTAVVWSVVVFYTMATSAHVVYRESGEALREIVHEYQEIKRELDTMGGFYTKHANTTGYSLYLCLVNLWHTLNDINYNVLWGRSHRFNENAVPCGPFVVMRTLKPEEFMAWRPKRYRDLLKVLDREVNQLTV